VIHKLQSKTNRHLLLLYLFNTHIHTLSSAVVVDNNKALFLTTETVQSPSLPLEGIDDIEGGDSLSLCVLGIGNRISNDALEEGLEDTTGLFVDHGGNTLDTTTAGKTADGGLGDALDVVAENLAMAFGAAFPESLAAFSTYFLGVG